MAGEDGLQMWRVLTASRSHEHTTMWVRTLNRRQKETKNSRRRRGYEEEME
jgi:hypothetical protein